MRISDWSSDVCSSDLERHPGGRERLHERRVVDPPGVEPGGSLDVLQGPVRDDVVLDGQVTEQGRLERLPALLEAACDTSGLDLHPPVSARQVPLHGPGVDLAREPDGRVREGSALVEGPDLTEI